MEALLRSAPELIVLTGYRSSQPSLANAVLEHPALGSLGAAHRTVTVPTALWACGLPAQHRGRGAAATSRRPMSASRAARGSTWALAAASAC